MAASPLKDAVFRALAPLPYGLRQGVLSLGYAMTPRRLLNFFPHAAIVLRDLPRSGRPLLPKAEDALARPDGLCGLAGRIDVPTLLHGYARGMFLMSHVGPLKWWAPQTRMVLFFDRARIEKSTRRLLRNKQFQVTFDTAFAEVMEACAAPREGRAPLTWITPRIQALFQDAHALGHAHSVEVWQDGALAGGAYGLAVGKVFFTESQFHVARDASKVGFAVLNRHLQRWGFALNDGKHCTEHLMASGMQPIPRAHFARLVEAYATTPARSVTWNVDPQLLDGDWMPEEAGGIAIEDVPPAGSDSARRRERPKSNTW